MIHTHQFNGLTVQTGDILCMRNGTDYKWIGHFWRWVGYLVPGRIDHTILYVGPGGRCIEAASQGVVEFVMPGTTWDAPRVAANRLLQDTLIAVAYPLQALGLSAQEEARIRTGVAAYCLAQVGKSYNPNFFNIVTDDSFYCSQLIYLAYREFGVDLGVSPVGLANDAARVDETPFLILPTMLLENCPHQVARTRLSNRARTVGSAGV